MLIQIVLFGTGYKMPVIAIPYLWIAGTALLTTAGNWYFDQPETINNYNFDDLTQDEVTAILNQGQPRTTGQGLYEVGGGLKFVAVAVALTYVAQKKGWL
jgi:hypothetical protein